MGLQQMQESRTQRLLYGSCLQYAARFPFQERQVMRQFQNLLPMPVSANMLGDCLPVHIDADVLCSRLQGRFLPRILYGYGIRIALEADGCLQGYAADLGATDVVGMPGSGRSAWRSSCRRCATGCGLPATW